MCDYFEFSAGLARTNWAPNGRMACQTCHLNEFGSADGLPNAVGIFGVGEGPERAFSDGRIVPRNTSRLRRPFSTEEIAHNPIRG